MPWRHITNEHPLSRGHGNVVVPRAERERASWKSSKTIDASSFSVPVKTTFLSSPDLSLQNCSKHKGWQYYMLVARDLDVLAHYEYGYIIFVTC